MKKFERILGMLICAVCILCMSSCGGNRKAGAGGSSSSSAAEKGYVFSVGGTEIEINGDMAPVAEKLGKPLSYFEDPSCAADGIAKIYTYPGFVISTTPDGDTDLVDLIEIKDDTVSTAEGADLSMSRDDIIKIYGSGFKESDGQVTYEKGSMRLCFIFRSGLLSSIQYRAVHD